MRGWNDALMCPSPPAPLPAFEPIRIEAVARGEGGTTIERMHPVPIAPSRSRLNSMHESQKPPAGGAGVEAGARR